MLKCLSLPLTARCLALLLPLLGIAVLPASAASDPAKVLRVVFEAGDEGFDPVRSVNYYSGAVLDAVGESLLTYDYLARPAKLVTGVAENMPEISKDGKTLTFRLRKGVYFAPDLAFKGQKRELTAQDFVFSFKRFFDPALRSQWRFLFDGKIVGMDDFVKAAEQTGRLDYDRPVAGLEAPDRYTLRIRLTQADYNFPYVLAMAATVPVAREVVERYGDDLGAHPVGTNAYMLTEYRRGSRIVLEANPHYRGFKWDFTPSDDAEERAIAAKLKGRDMPQIGRVEINIIEEEQSRYLAFMRGELDMVARVDALAESWREGSGLKPELKARGIVRLDEIEPELTYTFFNFRDPLVGGFAREKIALRRAMIMAHDIDAEIRIIRKNQAVAATMPIPRGVVGYSPAWRPLNRYNPKAANTLLDTFGYKRGADGWRTLPNGDPLTISLTSEPQQVQREHDELWRKSLEKIGIRLEIKTGTFAENLKAAKRCQLQMWNSAWHADYPDGENFLQLLYGPNSEQSNNGCYDSPVFNRLYEMALRLPPGPERNRLYEMMTRQVEIDGAWRFGVSRIRTTLLHPNVVGYRKHPVIHAEWKFIDLEQAR